MKEHELCEDSIEAIKMLAKKGNSSFREQEYFWRMRTLEQKKQIIKDLDI